MKSLERRLERLEAWKVIIASPEEQVKREAYLGRSFVCLAEAFGLEATEANGKAIIAALIDAN